MNAPIQLNTPGEPPGPPVRRRVARLARQAGLTAVSLTLVAGAGAVLARTLSEEATSTRAEPGIRVIDIEGDVGDVRLAASPDGTATVTASERWAYARPALGYNRDGDRLTVRSGCPTLEQIASVGVCRVRRTVLVPAGAVVKVTSSTGSIRADDLDVTDLQATTSAGSITVSFATVPDSVRVESSAGSLHVALPDQAYRVDAGTSAGDVQVDVVSDPRAARLVYAHTSAGNIRIGSR